MKTNGSVSIHQSIRHVAANAKAVFRAAHDSAKGVRTWMTDLKKK
jgi:GINS complex subunit 3